MSTEPPYNTTILINNYLGTPFAGPNDVYVTRDGAVWFTDNPIVFSQGIRPAPQLPPQVYRHMPGTTQIRPVYDGAINPNGITFSPDERTAYITDTPGTSPYVNATLPRTIYAFDVTSIYGAPFLTNKRLFALPAAGIPDGIKCDCRGNVYAGCGDGVNVWAPDGRLLGKIVVPGGAANFALGPGGQVFLLNEMRLWLAQPGW